MNELIPVIWAALGGICIGSELAFSSMHRMLRLPTKANITLRIGLWLLGIVCLALAVADVLWR